MTEFAAALKGTNRDFENYLEKSLMSICRETDDPEQHRKLRVGFLNAAHERLESLMKKEAVNFGDLN